MKWFYKRVLKVFLLLNCLKAGTSFSQVNANSTPVLDSDPIVLPRANALAGSVTALADDLDAVQYNPAGIGGRGMDEKMPVLRKLYFPLVGASFNANSNSFYSDLTVQNTDRSSAESKALTRAHDGKRVYARTSAGLGLVLGRVMVVPFSDDQVAAVPVGSNSDDISVYHRSTSGLLAGISFTDSDGQLALGAGGKMFSMEETKGTYKYSSIPTVDQQSAAFSADKSKYDGATTNLGLQWRMKNGRKRIPIVAGLAVRNSGGAKFKGSNGQTLEYKEDLAAGIGFSPHFGKWMDMNWTVEANQLTQKKVASANKFRSGFEYLFGGQNSYSVFGIRAGYEKIGISGGVILNLGLISCEVASRVYDIGNEYESIPERRSEGSISINVASF